MAEPIVEEIPPDDLDDVVGVLVEAFVEYETMRYVLGEDDAYSARLSTLVSYLAGSRVAVGSLPLGVRVGRSQTIVAAALVDPPNPPRRPGVQELTAALGEPTVQRMRDFGAATAPLEPEFGFYYLGMIGVAKKHRGTGLARSIVDRIATLSQLHPGSRGVLLTTEHVPNLGLYRALGFETLGDAWTPDRGLRSWVMFRSDTG